MIADQVRAIAARFAYTFLILLASFGLFAIPAHAQDADEETDAATNEAEQEEIVVTGSRLKRDTYTSISPLQVISGQVSREVGLIDASTILQESTAASGVQYDLTFSGFVLDNGPAASTVDLRGLGASRTLVLINGRRMAPSGVEGAPSSPDTNMIPGSLVQQYEVLLDGASSVYGSDAVAGVVNVILRKDFDGLELEGFSSIPAAGDSAGLQNQITATWGHNFDRGFIGFGAEYRDVQPMTLDDRSWTKGCERHAERTEDGQIRTEDLYWSNVALQKSPGDCKIGGLAGYVTELSGPLPLGSLMYTEGFSNTGIANLSDYNTWSVVVDTTGDGMSDVSFVDHSLNGNEQFADVIPDFQRTSAMLFGEYTFAGEANLTPYFEAQWSRRESYSVGGQFQLFPTVGANNPYNPCNPNGAGVDCGLAYDSLLDDPNYRADFSAFYGGALPEDFGLYRGALGATVPVRPVVGVKGDRSNTTTDVSQLRLVAGIRGDMPFMDFGSVENWSFDFYISDTESDGDASRLGIRGDRLDLSLGNYSSTNTPCENNLGATLASDTAPGCVAVNMFAPSLYANPTQNDFATSAERNYLFDSRDFRTKYQQTVYQIYTNGELFSLPGGEALLGIGAEYRKDKITSLPDQVAEEGLFFGFFADQGAVGSKTTKEYFAELELPLIANAPGIEELTANISTRHTKDEFYGGAWTYSGKMAYRPVDSLMLRGTVGTSYRAPNMRENFLTGTTGFQNLTDPCVVPDAAIGPMGEYLPQFDTREPQVFTNCLAEGVVDPYSFTNGGIQTYSTEVSAGGATDLFEEKSDSYSAGFVWDQPFFSAFDMVLGATYYEIEVRDEIIEPSASYIIGDCYFDTEGDSPFCSRIERGVSGTFQLVDQGFINRDQLTARGVDLNLRADWPTQMFGRAVDLAADFAFNRTLEISSRVVAGGGGDETDYFQGEFGSPEWQGRMTFRADVGDWRYTTSIRYLSSVEQDADGIDPYDDIFGIGDTCLGPALGDVNCRDIGYAENYFTYDASVYYYGDSWTIGGGIRNLTDEAPPFVDGSEVSSFNNVPYGSGYDIMGRTAFVNIVYNWQ